MSYTVTFTNTTTLPPKRIYKYYRIRHISISINPASQTYWVGLGKSSADRVIISEKTVVQPAFTIQVLSLESEVPLYRLEAGHAFALRFAPGGETSAPHYFTVYQSYVRRCLQQPCALYQAKAVIAPVRAFQLFNRLCQMISPGSSVWLPAASHMKCPSLKDRTPCVTWLLVLSLSLLTAAVRH